jgi:hypothetical protein
MKPVPLPQAKLIHAFADGYTIQQEYPPGTWRDLTHPIFDSRFPLRIKPREFPKSSISPEEAKAVYTSAYASALATQSCADVFRVAVRAVADAAVQQYILDQEAAANALNHLPNSVQSS